LIQEIFDCLNLCTTAKFDYIPKLLYY